MQLLQEKRAVVQPGLIGLSIKGMMMFTNSLKLISEKQKDLLDEWICVSNERMKVFEKHLKTSLLPKVGDPQRETGFDANTFSSLN